MKIKSEIIIKIQTNGMLDRIIFLWL